MLPPCVRSTSLKLGEEENSEGNLETCLKKKNKGGGEGGDTRELSNSGTKQLEGVCP